MTPLQTDKASSSYGSSSSPLGSPLASPTTPKDGKSNVTPRKAELKPSAKEAATPAKPVGDGVEVLNTVINLKAAVDKTGNVVSSFTFSFLFFV